jgi:DNA-binding MarR family transcriptional regulator
MVEPQVRGAIVNELGVASRYALELAERELVREGVEPSDYWFLSFIGKLQPVTRTQLTEAIGLRRTTVRDRVRPLLDRGHVDEMPNPRDGRSTLLRLSPAGTAIYEAGLPAMHRVLAAIDTALGGRLDEYEETVRRVRVALQTLDDEQEASR